MTERSIVFGQGLVCSDGANGNSVDPMKRILVTGGAGFLGSHLVSRLLADGHAVVCLDNLSSGSPLNLVAINRSPGFSLHVGDVCDVAAVVNPNEFDEIYNLACPASPVQYQQDPIGTMLTCVLGANAVLDLAHKTGAEVLQASTSEVYGDPLVHPQKEIDRGNVNPIGPRGCYNEGKRAAETLFFDYHRKHHVPIKVGRIFNAYGPRMRPDDGRVVSNFIVQALLGRDLSVFGDGVQTRSFCYVDDMIDGLLRFMATPQAITGPINIGHPDAVSIFELAKLIIELAGSHSRITHRPLPQDDPRQRQPDVTLAKTLLDWQPRVPLREGLMWTIAYFEKLLGDKDFQAQVASGVQP